MADRYVQMPINARMREAWEDRWQTVDIEGVVTVKTFMEAAARLGVGVFASAPLQEGALLKDKALQVSLLQCPYFSSATGSDSSRCIVMHRHILRVHCVLRGAALIE